MSNPDVSAVQVRNASGDERPLSDWDGKVLLIVNVASRCGFTRQYAGLQKLQDTYGAQGFSVLAFPCNDFGAQEPGSLEEIQSFCSTTYGVTFPIMAKVPISGAPFDTLVTTDPAGPVAWNFEKFLVGRNGHVVGRFSSKVEPESAELTAAIESALAG
ncbi:MAG: glutathione peroxidase [Cyanobacteriota bacterium]|jgi:glutathione peroxidase|nr:glutathione peroxidase [Cyanobacteriota bacterium]